MITESQLQLLTSLQEDGKISSAEKNLRCKIDSILRSLENLSTKKLRIDYEIKKQKKSLIRKRQELKKVSRSSQKKLNIALENSVDIIDLTSGNYTDPQELQRLDSYLLQESNRILEE